MYKVCVTVRELLSRTTRAVEQKTRGCGVGLIRQGRGRYTWSALVSCAETYSRGPYEVRVRVPKRAWPKPGETKTLLETDVEVSCNCPAWLYWGSAYNAEQEQYRERRSPTGVEPPDIRDPMRERLVCKHAYLVLDKMQGMQITGPRGRRRR